MIDFNHTHLSFVVTYLEPQLSFTETAATTVGCCIMHLYLEFLHPPFSRSN